MPIFLTIFEGDSLAKARPVLATADPVIIAAVRDWLLGRLQTGPAGATPIGEVLPFAQREGKSRAAPQE
jgi:hypothetical protein